MSTISLINSAIIDSETTSLNAKHGQGLVELSLYDLETRKTQEIFFKPNLVQRAMDQSDSLAGGIPTTTEFGSWPEALRVQMENRGLYNENIDYKQNLKELEPFQATSPWTEPGYVPTRSVPGSEIIDTTTSKFFAPGGQAETSMLGKTLWSYNARFEGALLGLHMSAAEERKEVIWKNKTYDYPGTLTGKRETGPDGSTWLEMEHKGSRTYVPEAEITYKQQPTSSLRRSFENVGNTDALYPTGLKIHAARQKAISTGDWSGVWTAHTQNPVAPGETRLADIMDLVKSMHSQGEALGFASAGDDRAGLSADVVSRLLGSTEADPEVAKRLASTREAHRAGSDAKVTEEYILRKSIQANTWLEAASPSQVAEAKAGKGSGAWIADYFARRTRLLPQFDKHAAVERLARGARDIVENEVSSQFAGRKKQAKISQILASGEKTEISIKPSLKADFKTIPSLAEYLHVEGGYQADYRSLGTSLVSMLKDKTDTRSQVAAINAWEAQQKQAVGDIKIEDLVGVRAARPNLVTKLADGFTASRMRVAGTVGLGVAATLTVAGFLGSGNTEPKSERSLVGMDYQRWLAYQREFGDLNRQDNTSAQRRHAMTDFGSPYRGPIGSQRVFHDQELLRERQKYIDEQYGIIHFDPEIGLFGKNGPFAAAMPQNRRMLGAGTRVAAGATMRGKNLMSLNLSDWKVTAEDADTLVLKKRGWRSWVPGFGQEFSIRMAGIDAPETRHGQKSYHAPQPHAGASTEMLRSILRGNDELELVYDPDQSTYGRSVGVLFAGGKNVNLEMVKRGGAAHLPYGSASQDIINRNIFKQAENQASASSKGIWTEPWMQAYKGISDAAGGQRTTFNTYTQRHRIVQNLATMDSLALMEQAQEQGFYSQAQMIEAQSIGQFTKYGETESVRPTGMSMAHHHYNSFMNEMKRDIGKLIKTRGSNQQNKFSRKQGYQNLDKVLVLDTMSSTTNTMNKRRLHHTQNYQLIANQRRALMANQQQTANQMIWASPINHHRM